jgi:hypothetical protein
MRKVLWLFSALALVDALASCGPSDETASSQNALDGGAGGACSYQHPECCSVPDAMPCRGLNEQECRARDTPEMYYCNAVFGGPSDPTGETVPDPTLVPNGYLGCRSLCDSKEWPPESLAVHSPDNKCYMAESGTVPDGWGVGWETCTAPTEPLEY